MFGFSFALVPFYDMACRVLGIARANQSFSQAKAAPGDIDLTREVTVELDVTLNHLPVTIEARTRKMRVHPGAHIKTLFYATNHSEQAMTIQAVPSITPGGAAKHFKKIECFCFTEQRLAPGETKEMPLVFYVDNALGEQYKLITLSYAFFKKQTDPNLTKRGISDGI